MKTTHSNLNKFQNDRLKNYCKGTIAHLLEPRPEDKNTDGINKWLFDSVQTWGESPDGKWTVEFIDAVT